MSESLNERKEKSFWKVPWGRCGPVATCRARPDSARPQLQKQHGARGDVPAGKGQLDRLGQKTAWLRARSPLGHQGGNTERRWNPFGHEWSRGTRSMTSPSPLPFTGSRGSRRGPCPPRPSSSVAVPRPSLPACRRSRCGASPRPQACASLGFLGTVLSSFN